MKAMISTEKLHKMYGDDFVAVRSLSMEIGEGQIFGFIGPNGAGKTTTIRMLCGLLLPTSGKAVLNGVDVVADPRGVREHVGYMPDSFGVYEEMRVWEYLDFFGAANKMSKKKRKKRIDEVLEITGSAVMRDYFVDSLSRGMRQRIGIAKTLIHDPSVVILDEPANGLDPRARIDMRELLKRLAAMGKTVMVSSHILPELGSICDLLGIIERGEMLAFGTLKEIMRTIRPNRVIELEFTGESDPVMAVAHELEGKNILSDVNLFDNILQFEITGNDAEVAKILQYFLAKKAKVVWFREQEADLEEAFMKITDAAAVAGQRRSVDEAKENAARSARAKARPEASDEAPPADDDASAGDAPEPKDEDASGDRARRPAQPKKPLAPPKGAPPAGRKPGKIPGKVPPPQRRRPGRRPGAPKDDDT